ncbi:MAG: FG-GAP-like repeat-containing protein [Cyclobacteriaceae bacterium]|nr:FG-GAP-like repeat-containing protein [Cyclobacteriaceae bacterium]
MQADLDDGGNAVPLHQITFLPPNGNFILLDRGTISPLVLNATTADKNETNVSVSGNLTFTFDQSVLASSVNSSNFIVRGEQTGIISGTFSGGGSSTVTFDPTADFKAGEVVRITLTPGIQSVNGGNLARSESYQFTTASSAAPETPPYFEEHIISSTADGAFGLFPADMDGDGDMDVMGTASGANGISWFENDGSQNFTEHPVANTTSGPTGAYVTDLDSDGDLDILVASQNDARIIWLDNDGSQNFTEKDVNASAGTPSNVYAADLDGDGDMDVLSTSYAPSVSSSADARLNYYINDGNENFTQFNLPNVNGTGAYPIDVDGDGDIDIVGVAEVATLSGLLKDKVAWYENDGSLNFTEHIVDATPPQRPEDTFATDMDGDGDIDILVAASINFIGWYENDGSQAFARHEIGNGESQPREIHAADVDGDGDMDVISAHELLDEVALWINMEVKTLPANP